LLKLPTAGDFGISGRLAIVTNTSPHKPPTNPPHSTTRRQSTYPTPSTTHQRRVVRFVGLSGSSGVTDVSCYPPNPHTCFHGPQHICPRIPRGFLIRPTRITMSSLPSCCLLAPEWQSAERFTPGYYLIHALATLLTSRPSLTHCKNLH